MTVQDRYLNVGFNLHVREWRGAKNSFVLLHGLASNSRTWDAVAGHLAGAGHHVVAVDQRGHGLSDKPAEGYDFAAISADLARLLPQLHLTRPILVGQSWGGNVVLELAARHPELICGLGFVDGGFLDLQSRPNMTWEKVVADLSPPNLTGTPREQIKQRIQAMHQDWTEAGLEATLNNFETLPDGTVRPWLSLERHLKILRAMWEQQPTALYPRVTAPTLICVAASDQQPDWTTLKARQVTAAQAGLLNADVRWFDNTDHDIHVHRPQALADLFLETLQAGLWRDCNNE